MGKKGDPINIVEYVKRNVLLEIMLKNGFSSTFLAHGALMTGKIEEKHLEDVVAHACPGEGQTSLITPLLEC